MEPTENAESHGIGVAAQPQLVASKVSGSFFVVSVANDSSLVFRSGNAAIRLS